MTSDGPGDGQAGLPIEVVPAQRRRAAIAEAASKAEAVTHFVPAGREYLEVPVVEVALSLPVYRADNGRILLELAEEARGQGLGPEELKTRSETLDVQRLLHGLLIQKARDPAAPIYEELEHFGKQTEPLLIQRDGVVLNGNRRLAAMRELVARGTSAGHFDRVRAALLPDSLDPEQLEVIEAALQMAPNLKLEYSWINRRLKLRQHARDMPRERIVAAYRFTDPSAIDVELGQLELAEGYLEWIERPGQYTLVRAREGHFCKMYERLQALKQAHLRALWMVFGFALLEAEPAISGNIEHYFPFADPVPPAVRNWVPRRMAEDQGMTDPQEVGENRPITEPMAERLLKLVDDPRRARSTAEAVVALTDTLRGDERKLIGFQQLLGQLRKANENLERLDLAKLSPAQVRRLRAQVAALVEFVGASAAEDVQGGAPGAPRTAGRLLREAWKDTRRILRR